MHDRPLDAIFRPALVLMTGRALGFLVAFLVPMILARAFTQEEFGTYKQLFLIYGTLFGIAQIGMAESLFYFLPNERKRGGSYVLNTLVAMAVVGALCFAGLWLLQIYVARLLNNPDLVSYIPYLGLYLMFMLMTVLLEIVMTVRKQHLAASFMYASSDILRSAFYIAPVLVFADLHWLMIGAVAFSLVRLAATFVYLLREFGPQLKPDRDSLRKHLGYALPFGFAGLIGIAQGTFHMYAVSYYFDVATFAIYAVGVLHVPLFEFLTISTANVMMTSMREKLLEGNKREACAIWVDTTRKLSLVIFPMIAGLLVVAYEVIVLLFTDTYERSVPIFVVWMLGTFFTVLVVDAVLRVLAEIRFLIILNIIQLVLTVLTIQWFITRFDLIGAVLVGMFSGTITLVMALLRIRTALGVTMAELVPWRALSSCLIISVAAMLPALALKALFDLSLFATFLSSGFVYGLSYFALLMLWGPMHDDEKQSLIQWMRTPVVWAFKAREN